MIKKLKVYHGSDDHERFEEIVYFSTEKSFSDSYGPVKEYIITIENPFHTCKESDVSLIFEVFGTIRDPYDNKTFKTYEEYAKSPIFYADTWEMFEQYISKIKKNGFDGMVIYEGGIENYICFCRDQFEMA